MTQPALETCRPYPPRWRWAKRVAVLLGVVAVGVAVSYVWWAHEAQRQLDAEIAAIKARGERWEPADFAEPALAPADNAVEHFKAAAAEATRVIPKADTYYLRDIEMLPLTPAEGEKAWSLIAGLGKFNEEVAAGAKLKTAVWGFDTAKPFGGLAALDLVPVYHVVKVLGAEGLWEHDRGDDTAALHHVSEMLAIGRATRKCPTVITMLFAAATDDAAAQAVMEIVPDLRVGDTARAVTRVTWRH